MSNSKFFIIGATGFIGATVYDLVYAKHPEYDYTALVRSKEKAEELVARYPLTHAIIGDLNDIQLIKSEAQKANIVINTADADNLDAAKAILEGLTKRGTPGFYIHTSDTGVLNDVATGKLGQYTTAKIYDDIENLAEIIALPDTQIHQPIDQTVLRAPANVKTAIISPPTIYGTGATTRPRILQIPWLIDAILKRGATFQVNQGLNSWDAVHVRDVAAIYLALVEAAASGGGKATWGKEGYYFAESQHYISSNYNFH